MGVELDVVAGANAPSPESREVCCQRNGTQEPSALRANIWNVESEPGFVHGSGGGNVGGAVILLVIAGGTVAGATQTDETGPILAFVGALLVVLITAFTTDRRQRRQLRAESERHDNALKAQGNELREQLKHDRKLADLQHLRELFDSAAKAFEQAHATSIELAVVMAHELGDEPNSDLSKERVDAYHEVGLQSLLSDEQDQEDTRLGADARLRFDEFAAAVRDVIGPSQE